MVRSAGSCTVCVAAVPPGSTALQAANIGDSGLRVIRRGKVVLATEPQVRMQARAGGGGGGLSCRPGDSLRQAHADGGFCNTMMACIGLCSSNHAGLSVRHLAGYTSTHVHCAVWRGVARRGAGAPVQHALPDRVPRLPARHGHGHGGTGVHGGSGVHASERAACAQLYLSRRRLLPPQQSNPPAAAAVAEH